MVLETDVISNCCPECGGLVQDFRERGEFICKQCGLIILERGLDVSNSGIRAYTKQEKDKKDHYGNPISFLMPDIGLSTVINRSKIKNPDLKRAVQWDTHINWDKRNLLIAITELKRISSNLNLPERVKKATIHLYKKMFKRKLLRGRSIHGMITACLYFVCKYEKVPITLQDILNETSVDSKVVKRCYKILIRKLNLKSPQLNPILLIPKYCADLGLSIDVERETIYLLKLFLNNTPSCGKDPKGLCAGAIYLVAKFKNKHVCQKDISRVVNITEVTLRSRYKELLKKISFNISKKLS